MAKIKVNTNELIVCSKMTVSHLGCLKKREKEFKTGIIPIFIVSGKGHVKVDFTSPDSNT